MPEKKSKSKSNGKKVTKTTSEDVVLFPTDHVQKISEMEALRFRALDAEIRNHLQGMRILDFEIKEAEKKYNDEQRARLMHKADLETLVNTHKAEYEALVKDIAQCYDIDPKYMVIDPEARIVRDLRNETIETN